MSRTAKIIIITAGSAAALVLAAISALVVIGYLLTDHAGIEQSKVQGAEFGKTTDYEGCQKEGISRARNLGLYEINESVKAQYFVAGCLETSSPSADFCRSAPTERQDIWTKDA